MPSPPENLTASQNLALGLLFSSAGAYEQAIPRFEEALRQDPTNETATANLALAYKNVGKSSAAIDLIRRRLKNDRRPLSTTCWPGWRRNRASTWRRSKDYQRAVELDPNNEHYYFDLGMEYLSHFTFGPAAEVYRVGTQKFPRLLAAVSRTGIQPLRGPGVCRSGGCLHHGARDRSGFTGSLSGLEDRP